MDVTEEDRTAIRDALLTWRAEGVQDPRIPVDYDADGVLDAWALDANDDLTLVTVDSVADTVFVSDGTGVEGGA